MTGNVTPLGIDVVEFETSKTLDQEFPDATSFKISPPKTIIQRVAYRLFPNKGVTNYIVWDFTVEGFVKYVATDTVFLNCDNFDNAETLIDSFVNDSFTKASEKFNELKKGKNLMFDMPYPSESIRLQYRNKLIASLRNETWS